MEIISLQPIHVQAICTAIKPAQTGTGSGAAARRAPPIIPRAASPPHLSAPPSPDSVARKASGWPTRCELAHAFVWKYSYRGLELAQLRGQLGVCRTCAVRSSSSCSMPSPSPSITAISSSMSSSLSISPAAMSPFRSSSRSTVPSPSTSNCAKTCRGRGRVCQ